jgi:hypothetical protein
MSNVYLIKPLEKKSIIYHVEMFRENADGTISWFNLDETYRWGQGFIEEDMDCNLPWEGDRVAYAKTDCGWGCEFDDSISIDFEFSDNITEEEQESIREAYYEGGAGWLYDGEHEWQEEDAAVHIWGPYQVSLCDSLTGEVIEENVKLKPKPTKEEIEAHIKTMPAWPFSTGE